MALRCPDATNRQHSQVRVRVSGCLQATASCAQGPRSPPEWTEQTGRAGKPHQTPLQTAARACKQQNAGWGQLRASKQSGDRLEGIATMRKRNHSSGKRRGKTQLSRPRIPRTRQSCSSARFPLALRRGRLTGRVSTCPVAMGFTLESLPRVPRPGARTGERFSRQCQAGERVGAGHLCLAAPARLSTRPPFGA